MAYLLGMKLARVVPVALVGLALVALALIGAPASSHPTAPSTLGVARSARELEALVDVPGPITLETVTAADWEIDRSGLLDLGDPRARAAGIEDGLEPIHVDFHAIRHPEHGLFVVDTGVERALVHDPERAAVRGIVASAGGIDRMRVHVDTARWLAAQPSPLAGVLLTHAHLDHVAGLRDVPRDVPVYTGPGELGARSVMSWLTAASIDRALEGRGPVREWQFERDESGTFAGVIDVLGDGSLWAIHAPGHSPGSTAFLVRTTTGPVLLTGDVCHTAWGWENDVAPGTFTDDHEANRESLAQLRALVARHPSIDVRLGHQHLAARDG